MITRVFTANTDLSGDGKGVGACSCLGLSKEMQEPTDAWAGSSICTDARFVTVSAEEQGAFCDAVLQSP